MAPCGDIDFANNRRKNVVCPKNEDAPRDDGRLAGWGPERPTAAFSPRTTVVDWWHPPAASDGRRPRNSLLFSTPALYAPPSSLPPALWHRRLCGSACGAVESTCRDHDAVRAYNCMMPRSYSHRRRSFSFSVSVGGFFTVRRRSLLHSPKESESLPQSQEPRSRSESAVSEVAVVLLELAVLAVDVRPVRNRLELARPLRRDGRRRAAHRRVELGCSAVVWCGQRAGRPRARRR